MNKIEILKKIHEYIQKGYGKFALYPFGENGISIKQWMEQYFSIKPYALVDNYCHEFSNRIFDLETFKKIYKDDVVIILTVQERQLNIKMMEELMMFASEEMIINIRGSFHRYLPQFFLPWGVQVNTQNKIKVRMLISSRIVWSSVVSVCEECASDLDIELLLIGATQIFSTEFEKLLQKYDYVRITDYKYDKDFADVMIFTVLSDPYIEELSHYSRLTVMLPFWTIRYSEMIYNRKRQMSLMERVHLDYWIIDSFMAKKIKEHLPNLTGKIVELGNAKYDKIFTSMKRIKSTSIYSKLQGKRVLLWITCHGLYSKNDYVLETESFTFAQYAKAVFHYISNIQDMAIILRFHPLLINELIAHGVWTNDTLKELYDYSRTSENIAIDTNPTYDEALAVADGVLVDAGGGSMAAVLPTLKPICISYRPDSSIFIEPDFVDICYNAHSSDEIISFLDMFRMGEDPMLEVRKKAANKYIKNFDGKNGYRIKEFIKSKVINMKELEEPKGE